MKRPLLLVLAVLVSLVLTLPSATADSLPDFDTDSGHFYSQGNGRPAGESRQGFEITNASGVTFWDSYQKMGGPKELGYPVSNRFEWLGTTCQAMQRVILQWDAVGKQVNVLNVIDVFGSAGLDNWLRKEYSVPAQIDQGAEKGLTFAQIYELRMKLLSANPQLLATYRSARDPLLQYGLPVSAVTETEVGSVIRTQRNVIYQWKVTTALGKAGTTTVGNPGEMLRSSGMLPADVFQPKDPPAPSRNQSTSRSGDRPLTGTGEIVSGTVTWYGQPFHGGITRYGEIYNMYDPTTCAANNWPYNTMLRVTATRTGKSVVVRVNNTGGFRYPILADLSYAAFSQISHPDAGLIPVTIEVMK